MTAILDDFHRALRMLGRAPGFSLLAIAVLALGIGASTAMFSAVDSVLLDSVPYPDADRLVTLWDHGPDGAQQPVTFGTYRELLARSRSFEAMAVIRPWQPALADADEPERLDGQRVSASYFQVLGVTPAFGPGFDPAMDRPDGRRTAVISDGLWQRRFQADPAVVGREVTLDDQRYTVVGVMPATFDDVLAPKAEIWTLLQYDPSLPAQGREWGHHLRMVARLGPGVAGVDAEGEITRIAGAPIAEFVRPSHAAFERGLMIETVQDELTRAVKPGLLAALGAVLLLLLIACVNVANLLLVRGAQRGGEFAARVALGAGPGRLIRQLLAENLLLAAFGGGLGLVLAHLSLNALASLAPPGLPGVDSMGVDGTALGIAAAIAGSVGILVGLVPALRASHIGWRSGMNQGLRGVIGSHRTARNVLVVAEVALAVVLLVSAGLLVRSLDRLFAVDAGFESAQLLTMQVHVSGQRFAAADASRQFFADALTAVRSVPGVESAAFTSQLPMSGDLDEYGVQFEPLPGEASTGGFSTLRYAVSPDYFSTMGIPLRAGRALDASDGTDAPLAAVISAALAKRKFADENPLGRRARIGAPDGPWYTIVGVAGDVRQASLAGGPADAIYVANKQWRFADQSVSFVVRVRGDAGPLVPAIRAAIWAVDKDRPITRVATMDDLLAASAAERRFASILFVAFGLAALLLAAIGIYGVLSVNVAERSGEIGLRIALGARLPVVLRWVLGQGMTMIAVGIALGLFMASGATRALESLLFGVTPTDATTFVVVALTIGTVALLACLFPLRRAMMVDPAQALRSE